MKFCFISDTHGKHDRMLNLPEADIICHTGDLTGHGYEYELQVFLNWFSALPYEHKVFIAGNHDWVCQDSPKTVRDLVSHYENVHYLFDEYIQINDYIIYGTPYQPIFLNWAFNLSETMLQEKWNKIPNNTDILLTHCPPKNILDECPPYKGKIDHPGSESLKQRILEIKPKVHAFGHIHGQHGILSLFDNITFVNGSILNEQYQVEYEPIVINL